MKRALFLFFLGSAWVAAKIASIHRCMSLARSSISGCSECHPEYHILICKPLLLVVSLCKYY
jgi:hypothetical protein